VIAPAPAPADARGPLGGIPPAVALFALALVAMGVLHFAVPRPFDAIMPRVLPAGWRRPLTYLSGVAEIACGVLMAVPRTRAVGGRLTALLLLAVWPANIDAALRGGYPWGGPAGSEVAAWVRVPLQLPMIWLALRIARRADARAAGRPGGTAEA
jgi:uncharacterized membrane protein